MKKQNFDSAIELEPDVIYPNKKHIATHWSFLLHSKSNPDIAKIFIPLIPSVINNKKILKLIRELFQEILKEI